MRKPIKSAFLCTLLFVLAACTTDPYTGERKVSKAAVGAVAGAAVGAAASSRSDRAKGAAIGAALGGGAGYYFDRQERILRERLEGTGVSVTRLEDGSIRLNMPGNITFPTNEHAIRPNFHATLDAVLMVFQEFEKTRIKVSGHTDSVGSEAYNQTLSERRAESVTAYFVGKGIPRGRFTTYGYGLRFPVDCNDTEQGRAMNRRVEIEIMPMDTDY